MKMEFVSQVESGAVSACTCVRTYQHRHNKSRCACVVPGVPTMMSRFSLFNARLSDSMLVPPVSRTYDTSDSQKKIMIKA